MRSVLILMLALPLIAAEPEEKAVLAAVQTMFDGMSSHNPEMVKSVMTEDARAMGVGQRVGRSRSRDELAAAIAGGTTPILERIWDPKVQVHGRIANVWAPYDFWANGKFGHCGVDTFLLVKTDDGWKVFSLTWTQETEGCTPSPLGPPK